MFNEYSIAPVCAVIRRKDCNSMIEKINLADTLWDFALRTKEEGMPDFSADFDFSDTMTLPNTVQQQKKPPVTDERSDGFLTDPYRFEGYAVYSRTVTISPKNQNSEIFLVLERTRTSTVWINGKKSGNCKQSLLRSPL